MAESTHRAEVVLIPKIEKHPNADTLGIVSFDDYSVVVKLDLWKEGQKAVYICPDTLVPLDNELFSFLKSSKPRTHERIKVKKLRGVYSQGLLVPAPGNFNVGDDAWNELKLEHYNPPEEGISRPGGKFFGGVQAKAPSLFVPVYDIESFRKYGRKVFLEKEQVNVTEKIHGANARFIFSDGKMNAGSRTTWKIDDNFVDCWVCAQHPGVSVEQQIEIDHAANRGCGWSGCGYCNQTQRDKCPKCLDTRRVEIGKSLWWKVLDTYPQVREYCERNPNTILFGECYGQVQDLKYGAKNDEHFLALFDIMKDGKYLNANEAIEIATKNNLPWVPILKNDWEIDIDEALTMAEGQSMIVRANHVREGVVIKPMMERYERNCGRVCLKIVGNGYLERA